MGSSVTRADLERLTVPELDELAVLLQAVRRETQAKATAEAKAKIEAFAREAGVNVADLFGFSAVEKPKRTRAPYGQGKQAGAWKAQAGVTYVNPDNADEEWTAGPGRRAAWVAGVLEAGKFPVPKA